VNIATNAAPIPLKINWHADEGTTIRRMIAPVFLGFHDLLLFQFDNKRTTNAGMAQWNKLEMNW
jgi:hypothetical protein